jgi:hypothetical protein
MYILAGPSAVVTVDDYYTISCRRTGISNRTLPVRLWRRDPAHPPHR